MWHVMANIQHAYELQDRLIRTISGMHTVSSSSTESIADLLEQGADVNRLHGTLLPLHVACMVADTEALHLLLKHGAIVNELDGYGRAALHYAAEKDAECVEILLSNGAYVDIPDVDQATALHWASMKNQVDCVRTLLEWGASVNAQYSNNSTPAFWAANKSNLETLKILMEYNADVSIPSDEGLLPLTRCAAMISVGLSTDDDNACLELLMKALGQFDMRDKDGQLPETIQQDNRMREYLMPYCCSPRSLKHLCRFSVRHHLGERHLPDVTRELPIPPSLREYVLLQR